MNRRRSARGLTVIELLISSTLLVAVLGAAQMMLTAGSGVARSTNDQGVAGERASRVIRAVSEAVRRGSLASTRMLDGTNFGDGASGPGVQIRRVLSFDGAPVLSELVALRLDLPAGAAEGDFVESEDGFDTVIARGVTSLSVSRSGNLFTVDVRTRSGPADDRGRVVHATAQVAARNP